MSYFDTCESVETFSPVHTVTYTGPCVITGELYSVTVLGSDLHRYNRGALMQDAFPGLSADDREFLISGCSPAGWLATFGAGDDE
jgi:hypothetical protein